MSKSPVRVAAYLSCLALMVVIMGSACSDTFNCQDSFNFEGNETDKTGGAGGEKMTSSKDGGAGGMSEKEDDVLVCKKGTLDCNDDAKDGCEVKSADLEAPPRPESRRPLRSEYTGSLHARKTAATLRPTFVWSESEADCGELRYEIEIDDSCLPGELAECEFDSPEVQAESSEATFTPAKDLPVSEEAPVGALYTWRVRACDAANCSDWSDPAPVNVGRTLQDLNGDGYGDAMVESDKGMEVYLGGTILTGQSTVRLLDQSHSRFVGDLNGDGFADLAFVKGASEECTLAASAIFLVFGSATLAASPPQSLCRAGGTSRVSLKPRDVGDLNGDGFDELVVTRDFGISENSVLVFPGGGTISEPTTEPDTIHREFMLSSLWQIVAGRRDYNKDGYSDFLAGGYAGAGTNEIYVLRGGSTLSKDFDLVHRIGACETLRWIEAIGDITGDQLDDWAFVCGGSDSSIFGMIHGGSEESEVFSQALNTEFELTFISPLLDFDGDGSTELLIGVSGGSPIIWQQGLALDEAPRFKQFTNGDHLDVADYNGDSRLDLTISGPAGAMRVTATTSFNVVPISLQLPDDATTFFGLAF